MLNSAESSSSGQYLPCGCHLKDWTICTSKLPEWISRKVLQGAHLFDWEVLLQEQMHGTILLGVLNESDGHVSHAVAICGGYVNDWSCAT